MNVKKDVNNRIPSAKEDLKGNPPENFGSLTKKKTNVLDASSLNLVQKFIVGCVNFQKLVSKYI